MRLPNGYGSIHTKYMVKGENIGEPKKPQARTQTLRHDTRHTTITLLTDADVDERFIAKIVGHSQKSLSQKVYSHISNEILLAEINKIQCVILVSYEQIFINFFTY